LKTEGFIVFGLKIAQTIVQEFPMDTLSFCIL
jgi:hypothetical protein